jgi:hypothetical protein
MFSKLIGIGVVVFLMYKSVSIGGNQLSFFVNLTKNIIVSVEVRGIGKIIYLDYVVLGDCQIPNNSQDDWHEYIRKNITSNIKSRDTSQDHWKNYYLVSLIENDRERQGFEIRSSGADAEHETDDDIVHQNVCH